MGLAVFSEISQNGNKATRLCRCGHLDDAALACPRAPRCALDYLTLRSEDHALLLGSLLLFGALAGAMIVTRRFDWYAVGGRLPAIPNTGGDRSSPTKRDS